jgi:hypothetical protein
LQFSRSIQTSKKKGNMVRSPKDIGGLSSSVTTRARPRSAGSPCAHPHRIPPRAWGDRGNRPPSFPANRARPHQVLFPCTIPCPSVGRPNLQRVLQEAIGPAPRSAGHSSCSPYDGERLLSGVPRGRFCLPRSLAPVSYSALGRTGKKLVLLYFGHTSNISVWVQDLSG